ncbi:hypothetical protein HPB52_009063 [Rhipicephalus sanguineus]|uniref:Uncharacterized protein n=1 Tax=Rhipicephalus sanguineus TaxID=34632 RepID=A0A9D4PZ05_RHISA|nr:hypothetical protein HPB52_009063 [Rhipicephalus sanguineus]
MNLTTLRTRAALLSADANCGSSRGSRESSRSSHRYSTTSPQLSPDGCNLIIFRSWKTTEAGPLEYAAYTYCSVVRVPSSSAHFCMTRWLRRNAAGSLDLAAALMYVDDVEAAVPHMRESGFDDIFKASTKAANATHTEMRMPRLTGRQLHRHNTISEAATLPMAEEFAALYSNIIPTSKLQGELAVWAAKWKSEKRETRNMSAMQAVAVCPEIFFPNEHHVVRGYKV